MISLYNVWVYLGTLTQLLYTQDIPTCLFTLICPPSVPASSPQFSQYHGPHLCNKFLKSLTRLDNSPEFKTS